MGRERDGKWRVPWVELESSQAGWDSQSVGRVRRARSGQNQLRAQSRQTRQVPVLATAAHRHTQRDGRRGNERARTHIAWVKQKQRQSRRRKGAQGGGQGGGWSVGSNEPKTEAQREKAKLKLKMATMPKGEKATTTTTTTTATVTAAATQAELVITTTATTNK